MRRSTCRPRRAFGAGLSCCVVLLALLLARPIAVPAQSATPAAGRPLDRAVAWLKTQQAPDGGFVGVNGASDAGATADTVVALAAARNAGATVDLGKALRFLDANALVYAQTGTGQAAKLVLARIAAGGSPRDVAKVDPLSLVRAGARRDSGLYGTGVFDHALAILALVAAGEPVPSNAVDKLRALQIGDGAWAFDGAMGAGAGDTNTSALVVQALAADGLAADPMVDKALAYLRSTQLAAGGFPYQPGAATAADANSTSLVVQALIATGKDPASAEWKNAAAALAAFQNPSGAFRYADAPPEDNLFATIQALPAIAGLAFPIRAASSPRATPASTPQS